MSGYRALFPNSFTMGNVLCGFISILSTLEGNITTAAWLIVLGAFLDTLDGSIARLSGATSHFGVELDSLADFLTFGAATGVLLHAVAFMEFGRWGWIIPAVFVMAAGFRLARFNLMATQEEKKKFVGLPVPVASMLLVSYVIFSTEIWGAVQYERFVVTMVAGVSALMVSAVTYENFPANFSTVENRLKFLLLFIFFIFLIVIDPRIVMFPAILAYILACLIRDMIHMLRNNRSAGDEAAETADGTDNDTGDDQS